MCKLSEKTKLTNVLIQICIELLFCPSLLYGQETNNTEKSLPLQNSQFSDEFEILIQYILFLLFTCLCCLINYQKWNFSREFIFLRNSTTGNSVALKSLIWERRKGYSGSPNLVLNSSYDQIPFEIGLLCISLNAFRNLC